MPKFDGTGPNGLGPKTGRGMGPCNQDSNNTEFSRGQSRGFGRGRGQGMGRGFGCPFNSSRMPSKETEINILKNEARLLKEELEAIQNKLNNLKD